MTTFTFGEGLGNVYPFLLKFQTSPWGTNEFTELMYRAWGGVTSGSVGDLKSCQGRAAPSVDDFSVSV